MKKLWLVPLVFAMLGSARPFVQLAPATFVPREETLSVYEAAELETGCPAHILRGIAFAESSEGRNLNHPDKYDVGMFGLHERPAYHAERASKYGEYDASNPRDAARIAGRIWVDNFSILGDKVLATCAHYQGAGGVMRDGPALWYAERVLRHG